MYLINVTTVEGGRGATVVIATLRSTAATPRRDQPLDLSEDAVIVMQSTLFYHQLPVG